MGVMLDQVRKFWEVFKPSFISIQEGEAFNDFVVRNAEEFCEVAERFSNANCYACFNQLKGKRLVANVVRSEFLFLDADNEQQFVKLCEELKVLGIKPSFISKSGPVGHQIFIRTTPQELNTSALREGWAKVVKNFVFGLARKGLVDEKCSDLARLCRVWGSINNKPKYDVKVNCVVEQEVSVSSEEAEKNLNIIREVSAGVVENVYTVFDDSPCGKCLFLDGIINDSVKLAGAGSRFNDVLGKNLCIYAYHKFGDATGLEVAGRVFSKKNHSVSEAAGWVSKCKAGTVERVCCGELRKHAELFYPEVLNGLCGRCLRERNNNIVYTDRPRVNFERLKHEFSSGQKFFVNAEQEFEGVVVPSAVSFRQKFVLGKVFESASKGDVVSADEERTTVFFPDFKKVLGGAAGKKFLNAYRFLYDLVATLWVYELVEANCRYIILSENELLLGKAKVKGMVVNTPDRIKLFNFNSLSINQEIVFVHSHERVAKLYKNFEELPRCCLKDVVEALFFRRLDGEEGFTFEQPGWLNDLLGAFLFSTKRNGYPLHLCMVGPPSYGKSELLSCLSLCFGELGLDMGTSTVKGLIPSFKGVTPSIGHLCETNRLALVDELFLVVSRGLVHEQALADLNNVLEHKATISKSGNGSVSVLMSSRLFGVSNNLPGRTFTETVTQINKPFLSRLLVVNMPRSFGGWLNDVEHHKLLGFEPVVSHEEVCGMMDYFRNVKVVLGRDVEARMNKLMEERLGRVPLELRDYVASNNRLCSHHLPLVLDGLVKVRCLEEGRLDLVVRAEDWVRLECFIDFLVDGWGGAKRVCFDGAQQFIVEQCRTLQEWDMLVKNCAERGVKFSRIVGLVNDGVLERVGNNVRLSSWFLEEELSIDEV